MSVDGTAETVTTQNVVVSTSIDQELDLDALSPDLENATYDPDHFPAIRYPLKDPKATVLIYRSGEIIGTGGRSVDAAQQAVEKAFGTLEELGIPVCQETAVDVENIVSTVDLNQRLPLTAVAIGLGLEHIEYEPEQFPGLIYRLPDSRAVVLLFGSGQVVITRCTSLEQAQDAIQKVIDRLVDLDLLKETSIRR